jgi:hypothetical protein
MIGEETHGNYTLNAGGPIIELPNSKIAIEIGAFCQRTKVPGYIYNNKGIEPDIYSKPTLQDIINRQDTQLNFTFGLIKK